MKYLSVLMLEVSLSKHESKVEKKCKIVRLRLFYSCKLGSFWLKFPSAHFKKNGLIFCQNFPSRVKSASRFATIVYDENNL